MVIMVFTNLYIVGLYGIHSDVLAYTSQKIHHGINLICFLIDLHYRSMSVHPEEGLPAARS